MTSEKIKEIALKHFAINGYEGASLAHIADDVGIKKQSIYAHFKGKDELFIQLCKDAGGKEKEFVIEFIENNKNIPIQEFLYDFLLENIKQYENNDSTKFWVRTSFFPPSHIRELVLEIVYDYLDTLEDYLMPVLKQAKIEGEISDTFSEKSATAAFLGILDGILIERVYGGSTRLEKRLEASWALYWRGLSKV